MTETKFISKLFKNFHRRNECQEIPRLRLFMILKNSSCLISKIRDLQISESLNFEISKIAKSGTQDFRKYEIFRFSDIHNPYFSRTFPYFLVCFEVNSRQIRGSRVHYGSKKCRSFGSSKIHLKSSGIDQESIIN